MSRWAWGLLYWGVFWFACAFLPAELAANSNVAPWPTLSATIQHFVHDDWRIAAGTLAIMLGLSVHFLFDQKLWPSLFFGAAVALSAHFLNNSWP
jgi:hypothetical protein